MLKTAAAFLIASQLLGFAQPLMCASSAHEEQDCEQMEMTVAAEASVTASDLCGACDMPECDGFGTCSGTTPAVLAVVVLDVSLMANQEREPHPIPILHDRSRTPVRRPPRG